MSYMLLALACQILSAAPIDFKFKPKPSPKPSAKIKVTDPYLLKNAKREGVLVLPSGVQIEMLSEGYGPLPKMEDTVLIEYDGYLKDGTLFDSSQKRGKPATFAVSGVVPGFSEGLMNVRMGGRARIFIPSHLAYGTRGSGKAVPPNSTLIFEIEILDVFDRALINNRRE